MSNQPSPPISSPHVNIDDVYTACAHLANAFSNRMNEYRIEKKDWRVAFVHATFFARHATIAPALIKLVHPFLMRDDGAPLHVKCLMFEDMLRHTSYENVLLIMETVNTQINKKKSWPHDKMFDGETIWTYFKGSTSNHSEKQMQKDNADHISVLMIDHLVHDVIISIDQSLKNMGLDVSPHVSSHQTKEETKEELSVNIAPLSSNNITDHRPISQASSLPSSSIVHHQ